MNLSYNARTVLEKRYLKRQEDGTVETPENMLRRVAGNIALVDKKVYGKSQKDTRETEEKFFEIMDRLEFIPNSPTLMNAGGDLQQLSACFVLPIEDSIESIFETLKHMALIQKTGGGTGFSFDRLRPAGDLVRSTKKVASGPVSFLKVYDTGTEAIKQGSARRGANMGTLYYNHPDILQFITCKESDFDITNFNISVTVSEEFMEKATGADHDPRFYLVNPRTGKYHLDEEHGPFKELDAREVLGLIAERAWKNGDPGLIFINQVNRHNPTPHIGKFETTNPCAEQPLLPYESCCLGSINLGLFAGDAGSSEGMDWNRLGEVVHAAVHFEDNVIDASSYVIPEIERMHRQGNRKIGIGVMGWHDMLVKLKIPYDSPKALELGEKVMEFINEEARARSAQLARERGVFPNFQGSIHDTGKKEDRLRNATLTTIAPTGTISIIAGASSSIEPYYSIAFMRKNVLNGLNLTEINPLFLQIAKEEGFYSPELINRISKTGTVQRDPEVPPRIQRIFKTALEIDYPWHIRHQAAFQKHTDNAVSKTINMKKEASVEDIKSAFIMAWKSGCKGITVYRNNSKSTQVLNTGSPTSAESCSSCPS